MSVDNSSYNDNCNGSRKRRRLSGDHDCYNTTVVVGNHHIKQRNLLQSNFFSSLLSSLPLIDNDDDDGDDGNQVTMSIPLPTGIPGNILTDYLVFAARNDIDSIKASLKMSSLIDDPAYLQHCVSRLLLNYDSCKEVLAELNPYLLEQVQLLLPKDLLPDSFQDCEVDIKRWLWPHYLRLLADRRRKMKLVYYVNDYSYIYKLSLGREGEIFLYCEVNRAGIAYRNIDWQQPQPVNYGNIANNRLVSSGAGSSSTAIDITNYRAFKLLKWEEHWYVTDEGSMVGRLRQYKGYHDNGQLEKISVYDEMGQEQGVSRVYSKSGQLIGQTMYENGLRHGQDLTWYEGSQQLKQENWYNNSLLERYKIYFSNGLLEEVSDKRLTKYYHNSLKVISGIPVNGITATINGVEVVNATVVMDGETVSIVEGVGIGIDDSSKWQLRQPLRRITFKSADIGDIMDITYYPTFCEAPDYHQKVEVIVTRVIGGSSSRRYSETESMYIVI